MGCDETTSITSRSSPAILRLSLPVRSLWDWHRFPKPQSNNLEDTTVLFLTKAQRLSNEISSARTDLSCRDS